MNLNRLLAERQAKRGRPVRVGLIGCGKFASMFLAQARRTAGMHVAVIADLAPDRAKANLARIGWPAEQYAASSVEDAARKGATFVTDDAGAAIGAPVVDVVIEATGDPAAGIGHALAAIGAKKHIVMVNVEADVLAGPLLAERAAQAGVIYSLAYGDQPALICEQVDWARACGFEVVGAGKGTKYLPTFHDSTPETVWGHYGIAPERALAAGMNPKMFNSFLDGTKSAIEMAAVANATGLTPQPEGLNFPPAGVHDLARTCRPRAAGGQLAHSGTVEVVSSLERDGCPVVGDLRWGTWVSFVAADDYVKNCFAEYGLITDDSGRYSALWRPYHLIGLELGVSVAAVACRGEATGRAQGFAADVVATAKRDLKAGEILDGEGGATVYGRLMPAAAALQLGGLPLGLAHNVRLTNAVKRGQAVRWADAAVDETALAARVRRDMERRFAASRQAAE
jgi:predicted homoserine dehydrogenase-like protein